MLKFLKALLFLASIVLVCVTTATVFTIQRVVKGVPSQIEREADKTRGQIHVEVGELVKSAMAVINSQGDSVRGATVKEIRDSRKEIVNEVDAVAVMLNGRATEGLRALNHHAREFETRYDETNATLLRVAKPVGDVAAQLARAAPPFLDCTGNRDCLFDRYRDIASNVDQGTTAVTASLPAMTADATAIERHADDISSAVDRFVRNAERHPPWWERLMTKLFRIPQI